MLGLAFRLLHGASTAGGFIETEQAFIGLAMLRWEGLASLDVWARNLPLLKSIAEHARSSYYYHYSHSFLSMSSSLMTDDDFVLSHVYIREAFFPSFSIFAPRRLFVPASPVLSLLLFSPFFFAFPHQ